MEQDHKKKWVTVDIVEAREYRATLLVYDPQDREELENVWAAVTDPEEYQTSYTKRDVKVVLVEPDPEDQLEQSINALAEALEKVLFAQNRLRGR